jgi:hypothetical protein
MPVPWLRILDAVLNLTDLARSRPPRSNAAEEVEPLATTGRGGRGLGHLEARLAGVMVAALKEAFDRDSHRLELEREQMERERERAERLLKIDLLRQAGDREIGRLRLLAGVSIAGWIGTLFFVGRLGGGPPAARIALGIGWLLLLAALALCFAAQSRIARVLGTLDQPGAGSEEVSAGVPGGVAAALVVAGLATIGLAVLIG